MAENPKKYWTWTGPGNIKDDDLNLQWCCHDCGFACGPVSKEEEKICKLYYPWIDENIPCWDCEDVPGQSLRERSARGEY